MEYKYSHRFAVEAARTDRSHLRKFMFQGVKVNIQAIRWFWVGGAHGVGIKHHNHSPHPVGLGTRPNTSTISIVQCPTVCLDVCDFCDVHNIYLSIYLSIYRSDRSIYLIYLSISIYLFIFDLSIYLSTFYLSIYLFI